MAHLWGIGLIDVVYCEAQLGYVFFCERGFLRRAVLVAAMVAELCALEVLSFEAFPEQWMVLLVYTMSYGVVTCLATLYSFIKARKILSIMVEDGRVDSDGIKVIFATAVSLMIASLLMSVFYFSSSLVSILAFLIYLMLLSRMIPKDPKHIRPLAANRMMTFLLCYVTVLCSFKVYQYLFNAQASTAVLFGMKIPLSFQLLRQPLHGSIIMLFLFLSKVCAIGLIGYFPWDIYTNTSTSVEEELLLSPLRTRLVRFRSDPIIPASALKYSSIGEVSDNTLSQ